MCRILGSIVSNDVGAEQDVEARISKARHAFSTLRPIWNSKQISFKTKMRIFNSNVILYGAETWKNTKSLTNKIQVFTNKCLRSILKIWWQTKSVTQSYGKGRDKVESS